MHRDRYERANVFVVGADHHNTLGVIRSVGARFRGIHVIVTTSQQNLSGVSCSHSRYLSKDDVTLIADEEQSIVSSILKLKCDKRFSEKRTLLIPTSDSAAYAIDNNLRLLSAGCLCPSIASREGEVARHMDKFRQAEWANERGLPMAKSWKLNFERDMNVPGNLSYPCIVKPLVSAEGKKSDIAVVERPDKLGTALETYRKNGYTRAIVQEFLRKDYELCAFGCTLPSSGKVAYGVLKKLRYYPTTGGQSLSYAEFIRDQDVSETVKKAIWELAQSGYSGLFDIEFLSVNETHYLNEINYRNSGNTCALVKNGVDIPVLWCLDALGCDVSGEPLRISKKSYFMNESTDLSHVREGHLSPGVWVRDLLRTTSFTKWDTNDLSGSIAWYYEPIRNKLKSIVRKT